LTASWVVESVTVELNDSFNAAVDFSSANAVLRLLVNVVVSDCGARYVSAEVVTVTEEEPEPKLKFTVPPEEAPVAGVADVATLATASTLAVSTVLGTRPFSS
jgi:hypothetical protein